MNFYGKIILVLKKFICTIIFVFAFIFCYLILPFVFALSTAIVMFALDLYSKSGVFIFISLFLGLALTFFLDQKFYLSDKFMRFLMRVLQIKNNCIFDYTQEECAEIISSAEMNIDIVLKPEITIMKKNMVACSVIFIVIFSLLYFSTWNHNFIYLLIFFMIIIAFVLAFYFRIKDNFVRITNNGLEFHTAGKFKEFVHWNELLILFIKNNQHMVFIINKPYHKYTIHCVNEKNLKIVRKFYTELLKRLSFAKSVSK